MVEARLSSPLWTWLRRQIGEQGGGDSSQYSAAAAARSTDPHPSPGTQRRFHSWPHNTPRATITAMPETNKVPSARADRGQTETGRYGPWTWPHLLLLLHPLDICIFVHGDAPGPNAQHSVLADRSGGQYKYSTAVRPRIYALLFSRDQTDGSLCIRTSKLTRLRLKQSNKTQADGHIGKTANFN